MNYSIIKGMKALHIVFLFVIAAIVAACSSAEDAITDKPSAPTGSKTYTMTINANKHGDTRALTLDGKTLNSSWKKGEQVKVIGLSALSPYALSILGTLTAQSDGVSTTLTGAVTEPVEGYPIQLVFPRFPYDYTGQKGTLDDIAANFDYATCEVAADQWELTNGNITTKSSVLFSNATQAIVKFNLQNSDGTPISASSLTIHDANGCILQQTDGMIGGAAGDLTINLDEPSSEVWVAISSYYTINTSDLTLKAKVGSNSYTYTKSNVTFEQGKYYSITVKMNLEESEDYSTPLTFEAETGGAQVSFKTMLSELPAVEYKLNDDAWTTYTGGIITLANAGDKVSFRGENESYSYSYFKIDEASCYLYGNIMSLITKTGYETAKVLTQDEAFSILFNRCAIKNHPSKNLVLPATTLTTHCYYRMFMGCSDLTVTPELPATTLAEACYQEMFRDCTGLTTALSLPATTLANNCYSSMFMGCTSLTTAPSLPAKMLVNNCYELMFKGCTSLTMAPSLPAKTLANSCYWEMFSGCTSLTTAPSLPAKTLAYNCYHEMFKGCTSLTTAPSLPATTLEGGCYEGMFESTGLTTAPVLSATTLASTCYKEMFRNCTNLNSVKCLATDISEYQCTQNWLSGVSSSGTFTKATSMSSWGSGSSGIPSGWTTVDATE